MLKVEIWKWKPSWDSGLLNLDLMGISAVRKTSMERVLQRDNLDGLAPLVSSSVSGLVGGNFEVMHLRGLPVFSLRKIGGRNERNYLWKDCRLTKFSLTCSCICFCVRPLYLHITIFCHILSWINCEEMKIIQKSGSHRNDDPRLIILGFSLFTVFGVSVHLQKFTFILHFSFPNLTFQRHVTTFQICQDQIFSSEMYSDFQQSKSFPAAEEIFQNKPPAIFTNSSSFV